MEIKLNIDEIIKDMREKSRLEVSEITDVEARYRAEAGTEKLTEIERCINAANGMLTHRCLRFLRNTYKETATDKHHAPSYYIYDFDMGAGRRANGRTDIIAEDMHKFIVHYALSSFYSSVSQSDLSNKHSLIAIDLGNSIEDLLYVKLPPRA